MLLRGFSTGTTQIVSTVLSLVIRAYFTITKEYFLRQQDQTRPKKYRRFWEALLQYEAEDDGTLDLALRRLHCDQSVVVSLLTSVLILAL